MSNKKFAVVSVLAALVLVSAATGIYLLAAPKALGNIKYRSTKPTTSASSVSFTGQAGERIRFSLRSTVQKGELHIVLCDSNGKTVYTLDKARELETFTNLPQSDTYTLTTTYTNFIGQYDISAYKAN